jgi:hypothetical protein
LLGALGMLYFFIIPHVQTTTYLDIRQDNINESTTRRIKYSLCIALYYLNIFINIFRLASQLIQINLCYK